MLFSGGTEGVGVAAIPQWRPLIERAQHCGRFIGVDERRYPRDFATFTRFHRALAELGLPFELPPPLSVGRFEALAREHGPRCGLDVNGPEPHSRRILCTVTPMAQGAGRMF
jgi:hypothetical protein